MKRFRNTNVIVTVKLVVGMKGARWGRREGGGKGMLRMRKGSYKIREAVEMTHVH